VSGWRRVSAAGKTTSVGQVEGPLARQAVRISASERHETPTMSGYLGVISISSQVALFPAQCRK